MLRKILFLIAPCWLWVTPAVAQNPTCPTRPPGDSTNACASTAFVQQAGGTTNSVLAYGAKCDGTTDDHVAFNTALNSGNSPIIVPSGLTCSVGTAGISMNTNGITLHCQSNQTSILQPSVAAPGNPVISINASYDVVDNCNINGNSTSESPIGGTINDGILIYPNNSHNLITHNVITFTANEGIFDKGAFDVIAWNYLTLIYSNCLTVNGGNGSWYASGTDIHDNVIGPNCANGASNPSTDAVDLDQNHNNVLLHDNQIIGDDVTDWGSAVAGGLTSFGDIISNNEILSSLAGGIQVNGFNKQLTIIGNHIVSPTKQPGNPNSGHCIVLDTVTSNSTSNAISDVLIEGNYCLNPTTDGIWVGDSAGLTGIPGVDIIGNHIENVSATYNGILITTSSINWTIEGNTIYPNGGAAAINVAGAGAGTILGNTVSLGTGSSAIVLTNYPTSQLARNNPGFNPVQGIAPPSVPSSGTAYPNSFGTDMQVCVYGGTVSNITIGTFQTHQTVGCVIVPQGVSITLTYSAGPSWVWYGL